jgi:putative membrane protein
MIWIARLLAGFVALEHVYFLVLEMFLWKTPFGRRTFGTTPEFAESTASMMANQGLYNGFLAAGLAWGLGIGSRAIVVFFLGCVVVAGVVGGLTVKRAILFLQALPAAAALAAVLFAWQ